MWKCPVCSGIRITEYCCSTCGFDTRTDFIAIRTVCFVPILNQEAIQERRRILGQENARKREKAKERKKAQSEKMQDRIHTVKTYPDENCYYDGLMKDNLPDGYGVMQYYSQNGIPNGDRYEGEWLAGKKEGTGTYFYSDGSRYEGAWKDDKKNGQGQQYDRYGVLIYDGGWLDNLRHGNGRYRRNPVSMADGRWDHGWKL